ncbi:hypothetical protein AKJ09_05992 [Labilithrix luteola]|uniref:Uncharacterized protein n=1 Tax=Labilithrix luteola TaxID=1391654 RepID=A0A0K1Q0M3_9BACT|nr:hypothetical protein [Labilithrix luteola]AKU99328.1 hypothetical protein AKJ09_05992 [Labilithrix luteola]
MPSSLRLLKARYVGAALVLAAIGCGSIADRNDGSLAKVSGQLQGSVPTGTRVALVWHGPPGFVVAGEAPLVNGSFTMDLSSPPPDALFVSSDGPNSHDESSASAGNASAGSAGPAGTASIPLQLRPMTEVSGGTSKPLSAAVAGFVVYADTNGNGKLDITADRAVPADEIIGAGNRILLAYLRDGSQLDLDNARDGTGVTPTRGYNLWSTQGNRWVSLSSVDLRIDLKTLPSEVCHAGPGTAEADTMPNASPPSADDTLILRSYPSPDDPNLHCAPDGQSYTYSSPCEAPPAPEAKPQGLCDGNDTPVAYGCAPDTYVDHGTEGYSGQWPCRAGEGSTDAGAFDGGQAPDAGF